MLILFLFIFMCENFYFEIVMDNNKINNIILMFIILVI